MRRIVMLMGMPRAATTFLYRHFDSHPDIYVPYKRKTNYFSLHFSHLPTTWFFDHFKTAKDNQVCIDTETIGFVDQSIDVLGRMEQVLDCHSQFILCVREPGEWLCSLYNQIKTFQKNMLSFEDFISGRFELTEDNVLLPMNYQNGDISKRIDEIIARFGERLLLIDYKEIQRDPNKVLLKIERFLSIRSYYGDNMVSPAKINASDRKNFLFFTSLMRKPIFIYLVSFLPVSLIKAVRKLYDTLGVSNKSGTTDPVRIKEIALAREKFKDDVEYYHQLFPSDD